MHAIPERDELEFLEVRAEYLARRKRVFLWLRVCALALALMIAAIAYIMSRPAGSTPAQRALEQAAAAFLARAPIAPPEVADNLANPGIAPADALRLNSERPVSAEPLEPSRPFVLPTLADNIPARRSAIECLTAAVYYEAGGETNHGQRAVAQVVLNRMRHPAFPKSVCGVVYQGAERQTGCQFTFTCDGSLARAPSRSGWLRAQAVAAAALAGATEPSVGMATHYHTIWVVPYWASSLSKIGTLGNHIFYRWSGSWGRRAAFAGRYEADAEGVGVPLTMPAVDQEQPDGAPSIDNEPPRYSPIQADKVEHLPTGSTLPAHVDPTTSPALKADEDHGTLAADKVDSALKGD